MVRGAPLTSSALVALRSKVREQARRGVATLVALIPYRADDVDDPTQALPVVTVGLIVVLVVWFPFSSSYNRYTPISGTVQSVSSRFLSDGSNSVNQRFAVQINGHTYGCDDTRCSLIRQGSEVTLLCEKEFQFNGTPGYACNWGKWGLN